MELIRELCSKQAIRWTAHIVKRLLQRNITQNDVLLVLQNGEIIELYANDYPFPSCLVLGTTLKSALHIVCGSNGQELWLITAYCPNANEWETDFKTRRQEDKE